MIQFISPHVNYSVPFSAENGRIWGQEPPISQLPVPKAT